MKWKSIYLHYKFGRISAYLSQDDYLFVQLLDCRIVNIEQGLQLEHHTALQHHRQLFHLSSCTGATANSSTDTLFEMDDLRLGIFLL